MQRDKRAALESVADLEHTLLTEEQAKSPEWDAVMEALEEQRKMVVSIGLEVLASHYRQDFASDTRNLLQTLADSLRASQFGKARALVELIARRRNSPQEAA